MKVYQSSRVTGLSLGKDVRQSEAIPVFPVQYLDGNLVGYGSLSATYPSVLFLGGGGRGRLDFASYHPVML